MIRRHDVYNRTLEYLEQKEASGEVILFRPSDNHGVGRVERDARKLERLYQQGYEDAKKRHDDLKRFMEEGLVLT